MVVVILTACVGDRQGILGIQAVGEVAFAKIQRATVAYILDNLDQALACSMAAYDAVDRLCLEHLMVVESDLSLEPADCYHWSYCCYY